MTTYTNIPKPSNTSYTTLNRGVAIYDDLSVAYDDASTYYDGIDMGMYTNVSKPTGTSYTKIAKP